jgi:ABC-type transporter Mla subunit MlaD
MEDPTANSVDALLDSLFDRLAGNGAAGRRALAEAEDHLHTAVAKAIDRGLSVEEAQREAVARFGRPDRFANGIRTANGGVAAILRPAFVGAWLVGSVILISIGFSGLLAELLGRSAGVAFVSGDGPGVEYTAERWDCSTALATVWGPISRRV